MKSGSRGAAAKRRERFQVAGADGDQPAGRIMALALAAQLPAVASFSVDATLNDHLKSARLHEYRLALRRIKTLLLAAESVFPPQAAQAALASVAAELHQTAEARNLDVVAGSLEGWSGAISPELRGGFRKVSAKIERRRDHSYTDVREMLDSDQHRQMIEQLRNLGTVYRIGGEEPGRDALTSSRKVTRKAFSDAWASVESAGERAAGSSDPEDWHRLRRRLKRVAYLLDTFGPILVDTSAPDSYGVDKVQAEIVAKVAKQVRKLQRELGDLQDTVIEVEQLSELVGQLGTKATMVAGVIVNSDQVEIPRQIKRAARRWKKMHQISGV